MPDIDQRSWYVSNIADATRALARRYHGIGDWLGRLAENATPKVGTKVGLRIYSATDVLLEVLRELENQPSLTSLVRAVSEYERDIAASSEVDRG